MPTTAKGPPRPEVYDTECTLDRVEQPSDRRPPTSPVGAAARVDHLGAMFGDAAIDQCAAGEPWIWPTPSSYASTPRRTGGERVGRSADTSLWPSASGPSQILRAADLACLRMRSADRAGVVAREDCFTGGVLADTADSGFLRTLLEANRHNRLLLPHQPSPVLIKSAPRMGA